MNGPTKMYLMKPIVNHDFIVELPQCMYRKKNIHRPRNTADGTEDHVSSSDKKLDIFDQNCEGIPGMAELEAKQNSILEQLAHLKKQIYSLKHDLNIQNDSSSNEIPVLVKHPNPKSNKNTIPENIAINVNPASPPYSLEVLQRLLQNEIGLVVTSYIHSSVVSLPEPVSQLKESLVNFKPKSGIPVIKIRLIWKNLNSNGEFLLSHTPMVGEVNLLRFISRLTSSDLNYESDPNSVEVDSILDHCYLLVRAKTKTERTNILQVFNKSLSKSQWLVGKTRAGVADIAAYSAIKQSVAPNDLSVNLGKWYERCHGLISL